MSQLALFGGVGETLLMVVEVLVFALGIYVILRFLMETRGTGVVRGLSLILLSGIFVFLILIRTLELRRLELVFQSLANIAVLGLIVVFQPEIRRAIVQLGESPIFGRLLKRETKTIQRLLRSVARLSKEKIGALIAVERQASLSSMIESGITIDAELNSYLIESIFYPGGALHDGAIIIRDERIVAASCLLPLSQNPDLDKRLGTRHRAALGITEETDAFAIVVSEETGKVSAAFQGKLYFDLTLDKLEDIMETAMHQRSGAGAAA
ncbi:MAG: TIGR00159 family protein [Planctomycetes bacterium]|nr:TIGR00159 family protein [Planctomycetota bacterium]